MIGMNGDYYVNDMAMSRKEEGNNHDDSGNEEVDVSSRLQQADICTRND